MRRYMSAERHSDRTVGSAGRPLRLARRTAAAFLVLAGVALGLTPAAPQGQMQYAALTVPGAATVTDPVGINAAGQAVVNYASVDPNTGFYQYEAGLLNMNNGSLTPIVISGASFINAYGINNAGQVVGIYYSATGMHGFFRSAGGQVSSVDYPGAANSEATGINDVGQIVGTYFGSTGVHGYLRDANGQFTSIDSPYSSGSGFQYTVAYAVNNFGQIAGYYFGSSSTSSTVTMHGYIRNPDNTFAVVDYPTTGAVIPVAPSTLLTGLNDLGQAVGQTYQPSYGGFLTDQGGSFTKLDFPTTSATYYFTSPWSIDSAADIAGTYRDSDGSHGFTASSTVAQLPIDPPGSSKSAAAAGGRVLSRLEKALCLRDKVESFFDDASPAGGVAAIAVASRRADLFTTDVVPFLSLLSLESLGNEYLACSQQAPDPLFTTQYTPVIHGLPPIPATNGIPAALAASLTDAMSHGSRAAGYLEAVSVSLNRYHSAVAAGNASAASLQESAAREFAATASQELTAFASGLQTSAGMVQGTAFDESVTRGDFLAAMGRIRTQGAAALPGIDRGGFRMFGLDPSYLLTGDTDAKRDDSRLSTSLSAALGENAKALQRVADILSHGVR
jgi:hypothetical protein